MIRLQNSILMWSEFLQFGLEELGFLVCNGFLVENEDIGNII